MKAGADGLRAGRLWRPGHVGLALVRGVGWLVRVKGGKSGIDMGAQTGIWEEWPCRSDVDLDCAKLGPDWDYWRPPGPRLLGEGQSAPGKTEAPLGGRSEAGPDDVRPLKIKARST
jgi:hypothetical protein